MGNPDVLVEKVVFRIQVFDFLELSEGGEVQSSSSYKVSSALVEQRGYTRHNTYMYVRDGVGNKSRPFEDIEEVARVLVCDYVAFLSEPPVLVGEGSDYQAVLGSSLPGIEILQPSLDSVVLDFSNNVGNGETKHSFFARTLLPDESFRLFCLLHKKMNEYDLTDYVR